MTEGRRPKNANISPRICAKRRIDLGGHGQHQWIEQRLAYKIGKYGQILLSDIGVLEFKT